MATWPATGATAATVQDAIAGAEVVILAVPYKAIEAMPRSLFEGWSGTAVIDAGNYLPMRNGAIDPLNGPMTDTEWVSLHFGRSVTKAFNSISVRSLRTKAAVPGMPPTVALPISADDEAARRAAYILVMDAGFKPVEAGPLAQSWRQQPAEGVGIDWGR